MPSASPRYLLRAVTALAAALSPLAVTAVAGADEAPSFTTTLLAGSSGSSEPRVTVTPDDTRYVVTNASNGDEHVYRSGDGLTWAPTAGQPGGQTQPTTDVDIVATRTGRVVSSELDFAGINFPTSYSDDGGKTWAASQGTTYADTDRQWFAVGPDDPTTHQPRVYLLFHNLLSGTAQHNMFVATSKDGGATFDPPVPVATPPQQDYLDLQCADSGGPSNIMVGPDGRVFVVFGTRSSPVGGCAAQPPEVNVVAADRVWVVEAPAAGTEDPTQWTPHLAVNHTDDHHIVGMQLAPGAIDSAGNVYVAYPESPNAYPNYDGGAIEVVHAAAGHLDTWSKPSVVAPFGGAGNVLPLIVAGAPGRVAVSWYEGRAVTGQTKPNWYAVAATSTDALSDAPTWQQTSLSDVVTEKNSTASDLMGACMQGSTATLNGFACGRSTDVNGIALDKAGHVVLTWPAQAGLPTDGTYVSQQTAGPSLLGDSPSQDVPEAPYAPLLAIGGVAAAAAVLARQRRRRTAAGVAG